MNISHKLMTLGVAFCLLGSTAAFARPSPHFESGSLPHEKVTAEGHVPAAIPSGPTRYAHSPSPNADRDGWPADMILG
jgi:hypothetical protein